MSVTYSQKLKDPRWQKLRLDILNRDDFTCQNCGNVEKTLNVHHLSYNGEPWETDKNLLITLCEDCHKEETEALKSEEIKLIKSLKSKGFNSIHFSGLNNLISKMPLVHCAEVQMDALEWFLDEENCKNIVSKYFNYLRDENGI